MSKTNKHRVASGSVFAAVFLTITKIVVAITTGSLGILSEAAHSFSDIGAAVLTLFAVKFSDKPPDLEHNYGHEKIESFFALIEIFLLLIMCVWIIYEAVIRLFFGVPFELKSIFWGIAVVIVSIIVDFTRSRALKKVAIQFNSPALHADALHFSSDVWSSLVVLCGLICVSIGKKFNIGFLSYADSIAAIGVSILVVVISIKILKQSINVLLDTAPKGASEIVVKEICSMYENVTVSDVRVRTVGSKYFIQFGIGVNKNNEYKEVHEIQKTIKDKLLSRFPDSDILITTFPMNEQNVKKSWYDYDNEEKILE